MKKIIKVEAFEHYLECEIDNGDVFRFDMTFILKSEGEMTQALKDLSFYKKVLSRFREYQYMDEKSMPVLDLRSQLRNQAAASYKPENFNQETVLFVAKERSEYEVHSADLGWSTIIDELVTYSVPGNHYSILEKGHVERIAQHLAPYLVD